MPDFSAAVMGKDETVGWVTTVADGLAAALASGSRQELAASATNGVELLRELVRRLRLQWPEPPGTNPPDALGPSVAVSAGTGQEKGGIHGH